MSVKVVLGDEGDRGETNVVEHSKRCEGLLAGSTSCEKTIERSQLLADILAKSLVLSHYETRSPRT